MLENGHYTIGRPGPNGSRVLDPMPDPPAFDPTITFTPYNVGLLIDVETTGTEVNRDEMLTLSWLKFAFDNELNLLGMIERGKLLNEPRVNPISEEITQLTGITIDDVRGHEITRADLERLSNGVDVFVAHNARFDRAFFERILLTKVPWICTAFDYDTDKMHGFRLRTLGVLLAYQFDWYFEHHQSDADVTAAYHVLASDFEHLVKYAFTPSTVYGIDGSAFEKRGVLKDKGFRWNPERKCWWTPDQKLAYDIRKDVGGKVVEITTSPCERHRQ